MARKLSDTELQQRCHCGVPMDEPTRHLHPCPIRQRYYNERRLRPGTSDPDYIRERARTATAVARALAVGRAYLASGGRPHADN